MPSTSTAHHYCSAADRERMMGTECESICQKENTFAGEFYLELKPLLSFSMHGAARRAWLSLH